MNNIKIEETKYTPKIDLDSEKRTLNFIGKSYPENTFEFYKPVMEWVEEYFKNESKEKTVINFEIIYFNSSSSKLFFDFFDLAEESSNNGCEIEINWIYHSENDSALEAGEDFQEDFESLNFNLISK